MLFDNEEETWSVLLAFVDDAKNSWHFKEPKEALSVYNQLREYAFSV